MDVVDYFTVCWKDKGESFCENISGVPAIKRFQI